MYVNYDIDKKNFELYIVMEKGQIDLGKALNEGYNDAIGLSLGWFL